MKVGFLTVLAPAVLLVSASTAVAQVRSAPTPPPPASGAIPERRAATPPPRATVPPPPSPAALSVPDPFAGFRPGPRDLYQSPDGSDRFQHLSRYPAPPYVSPPIYYPGPIYPVSYYPFGYAYGQSYYETSMAETYRMAMAESYLRRQHEAARGSLALESRPESAQVFVDGYYVGLAQEISARGAIDLDAGSHRIELRAPGYETLAFSVMIEPNDIVRYRGNMELISTRSPVAAPATVSPAPSAPAPVKSFYVIPGCYAGDKPPTGALPKGCDVKKLQTR